MIRNCTYFYLKTYLLKSVCVTKFVAVFPFLWWGYFVQVNGLFAGFADMIRRKLFLAIKKFWEKFVKNWVLLKLAHKIECLL